MKWRVLHVIDHTGSGGAQVVVEYLVRALRDRFEFGVAVLGEQGSYSDAYASLGVPVYSLGRHRGRWNPVVVKGLVETIRGENYHAVHSHLFKGTVLGTLAANWTGRRAIIHEHWGISPDSLGSYFPNPVVRRAYLATYAYVLGRCARAIVLTPQMHRTYRRLYPMEANEVTILPNAVDVQAFERREERSRAGSLHAELGCAAGTPLVAMIARLDPVKDWRVFLQVAGQVQQRMGSTCAFLVVGSGPEENALRLYASSLGIEKLFFLGHRDDVPALLAQADLFMLTSQREAFPVVLLEAMAAGCPIVATRTEGAKAIVTDEIDGLLADVGDVQGLADRAERALRDAALRERLAARARRTVEANYGLDAIATRMAAIYDEVLPA